MKYYPVYLFLICLVAFSCSKNQSSASTSNVRLVKTITYLSNVNTTYPKKEIDSFVYDNNRRIVHFSAMEYSGLFIQAVAHYTFSYIGSDTVPQGYTLSYYSPSPPTNSVDNYSGEHSLLVNGQNQIILDSVILSSNPSGINRYTEYNPNELTQTWGIHDNLGLFYVAQVDSVLLDNENVTQIYTGKNNTPGTGSLPYQRIWSDSYTYDHTGNPLFNTSASLIYFIVKGHYSSKNCVLTYNFNSTDTSYTVNFQNVADINGLLQSTTNQVTGDNSSYTYY